MKSKKNITGIILAGGKSSRMGQDKGLMTFEGKPFLTHIICALKDVVDEIVIVSNNLAYEQFNLKRVEDIVHNAGPLAGLYSGLHYSETEDNLVLSCDIPLISKTVLEQLINENTNNFDVIQISANGNSHPLIALYKKRCMTDCLKALESGERRLRTFVDTQRVKTIKLSKSLEKYSSNINTPNQLKALSHDA